MSPDGERRTVYANEPSILELNEHGAYEIRSASVCPRPGRTGSLSTLDLAESDLSPMDASELVASATGRTPQAATAVRRGPAALSPEDAEKQQNLWWYLLLGGVALLVAELVVANRLSQNERFT